ncbi:hypothetical protein [Enhydrobacter sp.]|jgi:hypothetical protein|uniref:hypothetical protein n=1 Tax=Enhydrobacter sp. TaxID=1894999 RepID=UPI00261CD7DC|nr:hypothetical protein [Enhydrobacter sp.]WIM10173.1 MAG: hypothetical protein OJF58_001128 [Enhydrobacter sp.]
MNNLDLKRARLRLELQEAYAAWLHIAEDRANSALPYTVIELSGCPKDTQLEWLEYLAAKERLVLAYAEQSTTA